MLQLELPGATDAGDGRKIRLLRPLAAQTRDAVSRHNSTAQAAWRRKMLRQSCQEKSRTEACSPMVAMIQYYAGCWFGSRILLSLFIFSLCDEPCRLQMLYFCGECLPTRVVQIPSDSIRPSLRTWGRIHQELMGELSRRDQIRLFVPWWFEEEPAKNRWTSMHDSIIFYTNTINHIYIYICMYVWYT